MFGRRGSAGSKEGCVKCSDIKYIGMYMSIMHHYCWKVGIPEVVCVDECHDCESDGGLI